MNRTANYNVFGLYSHRWAIFAATFCLTLVLTQPAQAEIFHCGGGNVACLIAAINLANVNGHKNTIVLEAGAYTLSAVDNDTNGPNGLPSITSTLTIKGVAGANATGITRISGGPPQVPYFRLMHVAASGNLALQGVTLSGGFCPSCDGNGLYNDGGVVTVTDSLFANNGFSLGTGGLASIAGTVNITGSRFTGNGAMQAGALMLYGGTASIKKSTFDHNHAEGVGAIGLCPNGLCGVASPSNEAILTVSDSAFTDNSDVFGLNIGGIAIIGTSTATISNTTFARNGSGSFDEAAAILNDSGTLHLNNVTLADNIGSLGSPTLRTIGGTTTIRNSILARTIDSHSGTPSLPDCSGPVTSRGHNFIGNPTGCNINLQLSDQVGDPGLDAFQDNGQPGNGHFPLLPSSRAIDTGAVPCPRKDQIGQLRVNECDTGAIAFYDGIDALP